MTKTRPEPNYSTTEFTDGMSRTWLVQRLNPPFRSDHLLAKDNPFAFGGGLRNGGLSEDAMALLRPQFDFDYMGAAEFEFGAVPKALQKMAKHAEDLVTSTLVFPRSEVPAYWQDAKKGLPEPGPEDLAEIYVICQADHTGRVHERIHGWATETFNSGLKEGTHLSSVLRPPSDKPDLFRSVGWLELDNGFMFFIDRGMFEGVANIFGLIEEDTDGEGEQ